MIVMLNFVRCGINEVISFIVKQLLWDTCVL